MPNLTNNQYDYMYPTSSPKPHCQSVTFLAWKKGLITIENGGQVATLVKTIIQQNNEFGAKMIIYPKMVKACACISCHIQCYLILIVLVHNSVLILVLFPNLRLLTKSKCTEAH